MGRSPNDDEPRDAALWQARVDELARRLTRVERRLERLEAGVPAPEGGDDAEVAIVEEPGDAPAAREPMLGLGLALIGRTLLVLAGAFLLRAFTEAGTLPQRAGTILGIVYAIAWIVLADRAVALGRRASATFHGVAAAIIGFPLLWEATVRFGFLTPLASAAALIAITGLALVVSYRRCLRRLAWVFTVGALVTALALGGATREVNLFAGLLLLLGLTTLWLGFLRGWQGPGWLAAAVVDGAMLLLVVTMLAGRREEVTRVLQPVPVVGLLLGLALTYMASFVARAVTTGRALGGGELTQGGFALVIGLGGAMLVARAAETSPTPVGLVALTAGMACYGASFSFIDRALGSRINFIFFSTAALVFTLAAVWEWLPEHGRALVFSTLAVVAAWSGAHRQRATLSLHGAVYVVIAAAAAGILGGALRAFTQPGSPGGPWITVSAGLALVAAAACSVLPVAQHGRTWGRVSGWPKALVLFVLAAGIGGLAATLSGAGLQRLVAEATLPGARAAWNTGVLAVLAVALAAVSRWRRSSQASWLVYPALVTGGLKLVFEDLRVGGASTSFVSLALYGGALILAPRLLRRGNRPLDPPG